MISRFKNWYNYLNLRVNNYTNLVELFKPQYVLLSLLGLFPYTIVFPTKNDPRVVAKSQIINIVFAFIVNLSLGSFFALYVLSFVNSSTMESIPQVNYMIEVLVLITNGMIAITCAFKNKDAYIDILNGISTTWSQLPPILPLEDFRFYRFHLRVLFIGWASMYMTSCVFLILVFNKGRQLFAQKAYTILAEIISTAVVGFYYSLVLAVNCVLKNIDKHCQKLVEGNVDTDVRDEEDPVVAKLEKLEEAYVEIIRIKGEINRVFETPVALTLAQGFHSTLRHAHALYRVLYRSQPPNVFGSIMMSFWLLNPMSKMYALALSGTLLKDEATKLGQTLHNIPVEKDIKLCMEIQHFSTLIDHHETEIRLYGFCSLDVSLMFNIIASVITYLVILVQFDL